MNNEDFKTLYVIIKTGLVALKNYLKHTNSDTKVIDTIEDIIEVIFMILLLF